MLEYDIFCERCGKFIGIMLNPIDLYGWYCEKCMKDMKEEKYNEETEDEYDEESDAF